MDQIKIKNLEIFCHHGVYQAETILGQKFLVDALLYVDTRKAGLSDKMEDSVSYGDVCRFIEEEMTKQNDKLLEKVAERLAEGILVRFPQIKKITVEVKKPWAPVLKHLDYAAVQIERMWHKAYIGAGSNLGDRKGYLAYAQEEIKKLPFVKEVTEASVIETEPYGYLEQDLFLNTVYEITCLYTPEELLEELQRIEKGANRKREIHWGPRTLDLDILLYDDCVTARRELVIPHPEMEKRLFVMEPLCELNPYGVHPILQRRFCEILNDLRQETCLKK